MQFSAVNISIGYINQSNQKKRYLHVWFLLFFLIQSILMSATPYLPVPPIRTIIVNTSADTHAATPANGTGVDNAGNISLRSALEAANAVGGTSIIKLSASTYALSLGAIVIGERAQNITINGVDSSTTIIEMTATNKDRILTINPTANISNVIVTINSVQFKGGDLQSDFYGGGAIIAGGTNNNLTLNLCEFKNNKVGNNNGEGGAVRYNGGGSLIIDKCIFTSNIDSTGSGGAVSYFLENLTSAANGFVSITNSTFDKNIAMGSGFGGGAVSIGTQPKLNVGNTFNAYVTKNIFTNNQTTGNNSAGGAVITNHQFSSANTIKFNYNRLFNNASTLSPNAVAMINADGSIDASNNWWGCNNGSSLTSGCNNAAIMGSGYSGSITTTPFLQLKINIPSPSECANTSIVATAGFLSNSANNSISSDSLFAFVNLPISFSAVNGSLSNAQSAIQNAKTATVTFTSQTQPGVGYILARLDSIPVNDLTAKSSFNIFGPKITNPVITSGIFGNSFNQTFTQSGGAGTVNFTTTDKIPANLILNANGNLAGAIGEVDTFPIKIQAIDSLGCKDSAIYTLITYLPTISISGTPSTFSTCTGIASSNQIISIQGDHLTDILVIKAPANFEIGKSSGGSFSDTLHFPVLGDITSATVYIRLSSTASNAPSGNLIAESSNALTKTTALSGIVYNHPTSSLSGTATICSGDSTSLSIALTGSQPWSLTYTDGTTPVTLNGITSSPYSFKVAPSSAKTYSVTSLTDANCSAAAGDKTGTAFVAVSSRPTSVLSGSTTICTGDSASLSIVLTGSQPWSLTYSDGTTPVTVNGITSSPYSFKVAPSTTKTYSVSSLADVNCTAATVDKTGIAIVSVNARPTSVLSGSTTICNGDSVLLSIALTGTQPWRLTYTDGNTPISVNGIASSPYSFKVAPSSAKTYSVTSLADANCTAISGDKTGTAVVSVNARPTSVLSGTATICTGDSTSLSIALSGSQPWSVTYTDGTTPVTVNRITSSPYSFKVAPSTTKTYSVSSLTDANCTGNAVDKTGTAIVFVNARPTSVLSGSTTICNGDSVLLSIALTGSQPWSLTYTDGTTPLSVNGITSSPYSFKVAPSSTKTYSVSSLTDANCTAISGDKTGTAIVSVYARPTSVLSGTATICKGDSTSLSIALTGSQPWSVTYTDGTTPVIVNGITNSPYSFKVAPSTTKTYSVSSLTDANCTANVRDITGTVVVSVNARPTSVLSGSTSICYGDSTLLSIALTGSQPWSLTYTDGTTPISVNGITSSPYSFKVAPSSTKTYSVTTFSDAICTGDLVGILGTATVTVNPLPVAVIAGSTSVLKDAPSPVIALTGSSGISPYLFTYSINNGPLQTITSISSDSVNLLVPTVAFGSYAYHLISVQDAGRLGCKNSYHDSAIVKVIDDRPQGLTYTPSSIVVNGGVAISSLLPVSIGGKIDRYEVSPALPTGLLLNTTTGEISGKCNSLVSGKEFTITAYNIAGSISCTVTITVNVYPSLSSFNSITAKYGDKDITITPPTSNSDGAITYSSSNSSVAIVFGNNIKIVGAGTAQITALQSSSNNYLSGSITTILSVAKSVLNIKADDASKCLGDNNPSFSYTAIGFVNGDDLTKLTKLPTLQSDAIKGSSIGNYSIVPAGASSSNYEINYQSGILTINPLPAVSVAATYSKVSKGTNVVLNGIGDGQFKWSPAAYLSSPNAPITIARVMEKTTYTATVTSSLGCVNTTNVTVDINEDVNVSPAIVFTPNGDGINDKFIIKNIDSYPQNKLQIFDQSGKTVYERINYNNDWDGTITGESKFTNKTYYYVLTVNGNITKKGAITILR